MAIEISGVEKKAYGNVLLATGFLCSFHTFQKSKQPGKNCADVWCLTGDRSTKQDKVVDEGKQRKYLINELLPIHVTVDSIVNDDQRTKCYI